MARSGVERKARRRSRRQIHGTYDYEKSGLRPEEAKFRAAVDRIDQNKEVSLLAKALSWNEGGDRWLTDATMEELEKIATDTRLITPKAMVILFAAKVVAAAINKKTGRDGKPIDPSPEQLDRAERVCRIVAACEAQNQRDDIASDESPVTVNVYGDNVAHARKLIAAAKAEEVPDELGQNDETHDHDPSG